FFLFQNPARHGVELLDELAVASLGRRDDRGVERAVGTVRARLVLAREILRQPRHPTLGLLGIGAWPPVDVLARDRGGGGGGASSRSRSPSRRSRSKSPPRGRAWLPACWSCRSPNSRAACR